MPRPPYPLLAVVLAVLLAGCGAAPGRSAPTGVDGLEIPTPSADPADFVEAVDNPWLPLVVGHEWVYESTGGKTITVTVADQAREVQGVTTTVVREVVTGPEDGVIEETEEWFAQDSDGNVWCFGESGSWEAGVDGAQAGLVMPAEPRVGDAFRQELDEGEAEDRGQIISLDAAVETDFGTFDDALLTEETTPLEPGLVERNYYVRDVGLVLEETVAGGSGRAELVEFTTR